MIRVADYVMNMIYKENIRHIFMVTGRGVLYLSDAVARCDGLQGVSVHHEQAAAFAAVGYAQKNEKLGACLISTGCAGTNTLTGVLCAWQDGIPCVFISGQNKLKETTNYTKIPIRTFGNQEADIVKLVEPITKYAVMIIDAADIVYEMERAIYMAQSGRKGPVWIDIPLDIQNMKIDLEEVRHFQPEKQKKLKSLKNNVKFVKDKLQDAKRPVILIGSGIRLSGAVSLFSDFLNNNPIPVVYDCAAVDICGIEYPLEMGAVASLGGNRAGNFAMQNADFLLVLGSRLSPVTTGDNYTKFAREAKVCVIDIDKIEHSKNTVHIDKLIIADLKVFLELILKEDIQLSINEWNQKCLHWKQIFPKCEEKYKESAKVDMYYLADCFSKTMPNNATFLTDAGMEELIFPSTIEFRKNQRCIHPASQGAMGVALPAAIGVSCVNTDPVITVIGDGSIMMNLQELQTVSYYHLPIKIFVINNEGYAVIRKRQEELFRNRTIGTDKHNGISCPNFEKIANCFDIQYIKIKCSENLIAKVKSVIETEGAVLCEVMGVENQEYIRNAYSKTIHKRFVQRPLEDQAPFLDRTLFLSEMIVEPIDQ